MTKKDEVCSDDDLLAMISLPAGSQVPDPSTGLSTSEEYDLYFRILRDNPGLLEWSRVCLSVYDAQLKDLDQTSLTPDEKLQILHGILLVQRVTLEKWVKTGESLRRET
jgi:hypothetical protein